MLFYYKKEYKSNFCFEISFLLFSEYVPVKIFVC